jgi:hypothetical protein
MKFAQATRSRASRYPMSRHRRNIEIKRGSHPCVLAFLIRLVTAKIAHMLVDANRAKITQHLLIAMLKRDLEDILGSCSRSMYH